MKYWMCVTTLVTVLTGVFVPSETDDQPEVPLQLHTLFYCLSSTYCCVFTACTFTAALQPLSSHYSGVGPPPAAVSTNRP